LKWLGQHIVNLIARFRGDVYMEGISSGTIASGGNLGLDSNNKIVKATEATGDITSVEITTDSGSVAKINAGTGAATFSILGSNGVGVTNADETITVQAAPGEIDHDALNNFNSNEHFTQANITTVGTIGTGTWQGTAIASAYLDADTAHYSAQKQLTYYMFRADIDTTKTYIGLQEADAESSTSTNKNLPILAPVDGKLLKIFLRATSDISDREITFTLETQAAGSNTGAAPTVVGTKAGSGCTNQTMTTYDFTTGVTGDNLIDAGDTVQLAMQSASATANTTYYITCLWEWDLS
tara:strand:+ start:181 stop:1068 length:888 start_codon:yes stop_codon:yes gene_type:complete